MRGIDTEPLVNRLHCTNRVSNHLFVNQSQDALAAEGFEIWHQLHRVVAYGAEVTLTAGGKPVGVTWGYGQGRVTVFLGTTLGNAGDIAAAGVAPFWEWDGWPDLVRDMLGIGEGR